MRKAARPAWPKCSFEQWATGVRLSPGLTHACGSTLRGASATPRTSTTSCTLRSSMPLLRMLSPTGPTRFLKGPVLNSTKRTREREHEYPTQSIKESISIVACVADASARLARSHCARRHRTARRLPAMSLPWFLRLKSCMHHSTMRSSKHSPPSCALPAMACVSKSPPSIASKDTSKMPPPMSQTNTSMVARPTWPSCEPRQ
mmetsp:Transcript_85658/g.239837  ORF Transcript_85658/g.239837 Transcript_85658/m.239837 type:complete len:203 (-) Transcript_85658:770-1378(-)